MQVIWCLIIINCNKILVQNQLTINLVNMIFSSTQQISSSFNCSQKEICSNYISPLTKFFASQLFSNLAIWSPLSSSSPTSLSPHLLNPLGSEFPLIASLSSSWLLPKPTAHQVFESFSLEVSWLWLVSPRGSYILFRSLFPPRPSVRYASPRFRARAIRLVLFWHFLDKSFNFHFLTFIVNIQVFSASGVRKPPLEFDNKLLEIFFWPRISF